MNIAHTQKTLFRSARAIFFLREDSRLSGEVMNQHSALKPQDYFEKHGMTVLAGITRGLNQEVSHEIKVPTEPGFEKFNDSGLMVNFERGGKRYRAVFGVALKPKGYDVKMRIEDERGKTVGDVEKTGIENITRLQMILALAIPNAFLDGE